MPKRYIQQMPFLKRSNAQLNQGAPRCWSFASIGNKSLPTGSSHLDRRWSRDRHEETEDTDKEIQMKDKLLLLPARDSSRSSCMEVSMKECTLGRRHFLKMLTAIGAAGLPIASALGSRLTYTSEGAAKLAYDPAAKFEITVSEVEMRRNSAGRMLMARIYQPKGAGPFPTVLDLHGGAWNAKDRHAEEPMDRALATSGLLVVAIDMTLASEAPYPACVQDANYGVRWLKSKAATWKGDPSKLGIYGSSSGGQVAELLVMRPHDPRYNAIPLATAPNVDATVVYAAMRSPVSDPLARFNNAQKHNREEMMKNHTTFFVPWDTIHESNPQEILDRHEKINLAPLLIMAGATSHKPAPDTCE